MSAPPKTLAAALRKIARLEAQLKAAEEFNRRDHSTEFALICRNADNLERMKQARDLLAGSDA